MTDFVAKPLNLATLRAALERVSGTRSAAEAIVESQPTAAAQCAGNETFDLRQLAEMRDLAGQGFGELVQQFDNNASMLVNLMRQATAEGNVREVQRAAHKLRGTASTLGAVCLSTACHQLEAAAANSQSATFANLIEEISRLGDAASRTLRAMLF
jgi:HPt (histidine-containing phosphotransfer) domain-containing protein